MNAINLPPPESIALHVAETRTENDRSLHFVQRCGLSTERKPEGGVWEISVKIA